MSVFEKLKRHLLGKPKSVTEERKKYLIENLKHAAREFGKAGTRSDHSAVPKEQQLSIDLGNKKTFGIINRILYWIENKFTHLFPRYNLFPEVGVEGRKIPGTNTKVKYLTPEEQVEHTKIAYKGKLYVDLMLEIEGNKLKGFKGKPYDTTGKTSKGKKDCVAYVVTLDGKLITHQHINVNKSEWAYRHSTLAGGKPVLCSGLMKVKDGKITYIDNNSGHYKPTSANLYNAVKKLEGFFSKDAKVVCLPYWASLQKQIPLIRKIVLAKQEPIKEFLQKIEQKGKDGLTTYERHFKRIKECNEQYEQKLLLASYKSPVPISDNDLQSAKIRAIAFSIRGFVEEICGHKPKVDIKCNRKTREAVSFDIIFHHENLSRFLTFFNTLESHGCGYLPHVKKDKFIITINIDQADKLIKDTSQTGRVNKLIKDILQETKTMTVEHSIRKIIGANYGHKPKIDIQYNQKEAVGVNIAFRYKDDCDKFIKLLDLKKHSYICIPHQDKKAVDVLLQYTDDEKDIATKKSMPNKCTVFMSKDQANKFIKNTLEIKIDSVEQLGNTANRLIAT
ncbi:hypothetical protein [Wolbachia endosymbiont of Ctenocephalides felis wCfeJ]|uniref:hypothetical protein n=1 Tax=Wolbachia endosymbiont of Ctenocephalides felis wCfeJ TaxID=2732594 RepID=UPI001FEBD04A|nr:hypothetical protein [Wolbachia endosymbiont of Ctenocephalides felis wCfeJ]WCR58179.1 MAG: hypothetical protein PG980_000651 [Wolbachia endosymbiont of Ctenocephalides felis wCfeJ]